MKLFDVISTIANASGATDAAKNLLENALQKEQQDQILTLTVKTSYLMAKIEQAEAVIKELRQAHGEALRDRDKALTELNNLQIDHEEVKFETDKIHSTAFQEGLDVGVEKGREAANEDRDAQDILNIETAAAITMEKIGVARKDSYKKGYEAGLIKSKEASTE